MIIIVAAESGKTPSTGISHYDSYQNERDAYNAKCNLLKTLHDITLQEKSPNKSSAYHKTTDYAVHRTIITNEWGTTEREVVVTIVPDNGLLKKKWHWEDRIITNGQGGETNLKGWHLE